MVVGVAMRKCHIVVNRCVSQTRHACALISFVIYCSYLFQLPLGWLIFLINLFSAVVAWC